MKPVAIGSICAPSATPRGANRSTGIWILRGRGDAEIRDALARFREVYGSYLRMSR